MSSVTRQLIEDLRIALGKTKPLAAPKKAEHVSALPKISFSDRVMPPPKEINEHQRSSVEVQFAREAKDYTTALVGIGHVGTRYATDVVLQFQAELAVAHEAVGALLPDGWAEQHGFLALNSRVNDHREFLLRPDLGRRLSHDSLVLLKERAEKNVDVQPILADGLSAVACLKTGPAIMQSFVEECQRLGLKTGTPICARFARVWLEDEIGQEVNAKVAVIILGERPGLGTGDGLSAYLVHQPKIGKTDGDRNMISNIHQRGIIPQAAAQRLALMSKAMIDQNCSGVDLDLSAFAKELGEAAGRGLREAQERKRLVHVEQP